MTSFFLTHGSYIGIIAVLILTGTGLPIPEEVPVIAAGVLSSHGALDPWLAFFSCLIGALGGDCVMYWIGRHFGSNVVREHPWCEPIFLIRPECTVDLGPGSGPAVGPVQAERRPGRPRRQPGCHLRQVKGGRTE